ncbi:DUF1622 domain-containing protein [Candidatus Bathyarchaeota archaeon A05DMB-2]|nr:DUF1622 domain-containing protein [Candidatus Bathyarchaeota archaeon A05DMB-2]
MSECTVPTTKKRMDPLTLAVLAVIAIAVVVGTTITVGYKDLGNLFQPGGVTYVPGGTVYEVIYVLLTVGTNILYMLGALVVVFGALVVTVRFIQCKLREAYKPSCVTRFLSGYLTLSLEFFIGAEIIKTTVTRTWEEFSVLILIILSRGLFSLILYLERRWHGGEETE